VFTRTSKRNFTNFTTRYFGEEYYDSISYNNGRIEGMSFGSDFYFDDAKTDYKIDSTKLFSKIWRWSFQPHIRKHIDYGNEVNSRFFNVFLRDVSHLYNITSNNLRITLDQPFVKTVYLCTFSLGQGCVPVDANRPQKKYVEFRNIGKSIAYQLMYIDKGEFVPLGNPIIFFSDETQKRLNPDCMQTESVILKRKYMLTSLWPPRWMTSVGCKFELSDNADFTKTDLLYEITEQPIGGVQHVNTNPTKAYRYVRVIKPAPPLIKANTQIAELSYYTTAENGEYQKLSGTIFSSIDYDDYLKAFDNDFLTFADVRAKRWIAVDFGEPQKITSIEYCLWNDGNFIEKGDHYELFYYDMEWKSLGSQIAETNYLIYENVPKNALLWLKNRTKGKEERPFTYENGKQIWW